jgi:hypothetical protein
MARIEEETRNDAIRYDEESPLLGEQVNEGEAAAEPETPAKKRRARWYIKIIIWIIIAAAIAAVFIKGWVDAGGDVKVGARF